MTEVCEAWERTKRLLKRFPSQATKITGKAPTLEESGHKPVAREVTQPYLKAVERQTIDRYHAQHETAGNLQRKRYAGTAMPIWRILGAVCVATGMKPDELRARTKKREVVRARMLLCYLSVKLREDISLPTISKLMGVCDHQVVKYNYRQFLVHRDREPLAQWCQHPDVAPLLAAADATPYTRTRFGRGGNHRLTKELSLAA
jgi:hypothetical protein